MTENPPVPEHPMPGSVPPKPQAPLMPTTYGWARMILIGLAVLSIGMTIAIGGFYLGQQQNRSKTITSAHPTATVTPASNAANTTKDWHTYDQKSTYGYSFKYPANWELVTEGGAGCGPVFSPVDTTIKMSLSICGPYIDPGDSPEAITKRVVGFTITPVTVAGVVGMQEEETVEKNGHFEYQRNSFVGKVATVAYINGSKTRTTGTLAVYFSVYDKAQVESGTAVLNTILSTFTFLQQIEPTASVSPTTTVGKTSTYTDKDLGYSISYGPQWILRRTYGKDIEKLAPTDILSGIDLTYNTTINNTPFTQATIVVNVLDAHGLTDVQTWISQYDQNYPKNATKTVTTFHGYPAITYVSTDGPNEYIYFIAGKYAYRISYKENSGISNLTTSVVESFKP